MKWKTKFKNKQNSAFNFLLCIKKTFKKINILQIQPVTTVNVTESPSKVKFFNKIASLISDHFDAPLHTTNARTLTKTGFLKFDCNTLNSFNILRMNVDIPLISAYTRVNC